MLQRRVAEGLIAVSIVLIPWTLWLTWTLPTKHVANHWRLAWVGYDVALAGLLLWAGIEGIRRSPKIEAAAMAAGTLLLADAWFDVLTSGRGIELAEAIGEALLAEIPLALVCFWIAYDAERFFLRTDRLRSR
jgi:hypothetical protein